jgi:hypothetical protein
MSSPLGGGIKFIYLFNMPSNADPSIRFTCPAMLIEQSQHSFIHA